jgi:hypothetical protein
MIKIEIMNKIHRKKLKISKTGHQIHTLKDIL